MFTLENVKRVFAIHEAGIKLPVEKEGENVKNVTVRVATAAHTLRAYVRCTVAVT